MKVIDGIRLLFPAGSPNWQFRLPPQDALGEPSQPTANQEKKAPYPTGQSGGDVEWSQPPADPIDLFAVVAFLLSRSGAYHHVQPETAPPVQGVARRVTVTREDRELWCQVGRMWAATTENVTSDGTEFVQLVLPDLVRKLWTEIRACFDMPLFHPLRREDPAPAWWRPALALLVISDEAALDVGFVAEGKPLLQLLNVAAEYRIRKAFENRHDGEGDGLYTLSEACADVACILPKSRTPALGCTVRSLSHNLALLPPRGLARAQWLAPATPRGFHDAASPLNLLLIPYPYSVPASAFETSGASTADSCVDWGWFSVAPAKGSESEQQLFLKFVKDLLKQARRDVTDIHGIVFPELALSHSLYLKLVGELAAEEGIEFLACGLNTDSGGNPGNFAVTRIISKGVLGPVVAEDIRQKHHRWRMERGQITSYALGSRLDPSRCWWEQLDVLNRTLTVGVLRGETTIATLICEDLARVDPAQELLRAIGPNIVLALLMDGAQLVTRWPNRYATVLADDPGSSVLTLTSFGLIQRVNDTGFHPPSRCIALWRDDQGVRELKLPVGAHALCLMLSPTRIEEATLDGRADGHNSTSWRLGGVQPVHAPGTEDPRWIS